VLGTGLTAPEENKTLAAMLGVDLADDCFIKDVEPKFQPVDTNRDGIFVCGLANGPMNITESIVQSRAAGHRAAALLAHGRLEPSQNISEVNERRCTGCGLCIAACPYNARTKDENRRVTVVISELCRGCGACSAVCPNGAATLKELGSKQVFSMLDIALQI
jgi:heterodisulfide reductase subunit A-like polyferredoxin